MRYFDAFSRWYDNLKNSWHRLGIFLLFVLAWDIPFAWWCWNGSLVAGALFITVFVAFIVIGLVKGLRSASSTDKE